ncbi:hypothetical protein GCM10027027_20890 [Neomicrococcus lactis]
MRKELHGFHADPGGIEDNGKRIAAHGVSAKDVDLLEAAGCHCFIVAQALGAGLV